MKRLIPASFVALLVFAGCAKSNDDAMYSHYQTLLEKDAVIGVIDQLLINTDNRDWMKVKNASRLKCFLT